MMSPDVSGAPSATASGPSPGGSLRVCLALIGGELFALDLRYVREVFPVEHLTPVPRLPSVIVGVANLRGTIMPLVDVRAALGLSGHMAGQRYAVVISHGIQQAGLLVDDVPEIRTVAKDTLLAPPAQQDRAARPFISAMVSFDGRMGGMVEVPTLLAGVEGG